MTSPYNVNLFKAAERGDLAGVKNALKSGASIHYCVDKKAVLGISAYNGHFQIVQYLMECGANPYFPYDDKSPRNWALDQKHKNVANYLETIMKLPKWVNKIDDETGYTPLTRTTFDKNVQNTQTIIDFGADVCRSDRHGKTPLIYAIEQDSMEIVKKLLAKGAITSGVSAVKCALELRNNDILKVLINTKGLLIDGYFDDGYTALTKSLTTYNTEIARYLIEKGADIAKRDNNHNTPLPKALEVNCLEIAELLLSKGAKVPKTLDEKLFRKLAEDGHVEVYKFLIKNGWDIHQLDKNGKSALSLSAANQYLQLSTFLIENGASLSLAKSDLEAFRKKNVDFDCFIKHIAPEDKEVPEELWSWNQTGQE